VTARRLLRHDDPIPTRREASQSGVIAAISEPAESSSSHASVEAFGGVLAIDVNETLLDLSALDAPFTSAFGDSSLRPPWFQIMLRLSFVGGLTGEYVDFTQAQRAALEMLAVRAGVDLDRDAAEAIVEEMKRLPPHEDARPALTRLREAGRRQVALTNSPLAVARAQLDHAGLRSLFDDVLSADEVRQLKPGPRPYRLVATRMGVEIGDVMLVAAHDWDISGALAAGARGAFIARPEMVPSPLGKQPDLVAADLGELASALTTQP
jgi:2-haloacid dehalogenase